MDWLQGGYYPLRTPEGGENGYLCLNLLPGKIEIMVVLDRAPACGMGMEGCFTEHLAVKCGENPMHFPPSANAGKYRGRCTVALSQQTFPEGSVDYTLFSGGRPIAAAVLYTAPEVTDEQPATEDPEIQEIPESPEEPEPAEEVTEAHEDPQPFSIALTSFDPFNTTNEAYQWWLCQNNEEFHRLMAQTGLIPYPPLYTALQSALVRFGHFLFGRYTEEHGGRVLFILGVPGLESGGQDAGSPRWIPAQNKITGVFEYTGYGLHYFDAETGKAVRAVIRQ